MVRVFLVFVMLMSGTATSQLPEFAQQYRQRLGGAIDALSQVVAEFHRDASAFGLSIDEAVERLKSAPDAFARQRGETMAETVQRLERLTGQQAALQEAGPFHRVGVFLTGLDPELAQATAGDYEPAVPVTAEGLASAGIGGLIGLVLGQGCVSLFRSRARRRRAT